jgi:uncharacterized membrane protein YhaH (DUF805 family)
MKNTFYKSKYWIINHIILVSICEIMVIIAFFISFEIDHSNPNMVLGFILAFLFVLFLFSLVFILAPRTFLSKFTLSNEKISWIIFKNIIVEFGWDEIVDVKIEYRFYRKCLVFYLTKQIPGYEKKAYYFNVDKENIVSVYYYCKNDEIKKKINNYIANKDFETHCVIWKRN